MITLKLGRTNTTALLDEIDGDLATLKWFLVDGYAVRLNPNERPKRINLHRLVMERTLNRTLTPSELVDHVNRVRTDNRRSNLRLTDRRTNGQNRPANRNNRSGYKGVSWFKAMRKWRVTLNIGSEQIEVGYFDDIRDAVIAYNQSAVTHFGLFAYLNPVPEANPSPCAE